MGLLEDDKVSLRAMEPEDIETIYKWENNTENWRISNTLIPYSKYLIKQFIESSKGDLFEDKQLRLMIENSETRKIIGAVDLFDFDPFHNRAGLGILIADKNDRNKGYASQALRLAIHYCFSFLRLHQLYCNISAGNKKSLKLFKNQGFEISGCKKDWIMSDSGWEDEYFLQLLNLEMYPKNT
jgi:diamine N-acetyltransferase